MTYGIPQRSAHALTESRACFLVPTNSTVPPLPAIVGGEPPRLGEQVLGLQQVDDVDPVALAVDVAAHARVPAPRLVAEVKPGLQQVLESGLGH